ncbi:MAG: DUF4469 domain-containing protein [Bacteroidales bacterium]|nr:DUF4469 domain-containing protein [Bacteroidales bacterium]
MTKIYHRIKAYLYNSVHRETSDKYTAKVSSERSLNVRQLCEAAIARRGVYMSVSSMEDTVNQFLQEMSHQLCDGFSINTGYFTAGLHIDGIFHNPDEQFNPEKHRVSFNFHQGTTLLQKIEQIEIQIQGLAHVALYISQVTDIRTGSVNDLLTPGRSLKINGCKLKLEGDNEANGVCFINQATQKRIKVDKSDVLTNNPSELIVLIPDLPSGSYKLEITTQCAMGAVLKEPHTTVLNKILTVL